jgi:hypothetical protein
MVMKDRLTILSGVLQHVVAMPARDRDEGNGLGVVANFLDEGGRLLDNFVETIFAPLQRIVRRQQPREKRSGTPWWYPSC